MKIEKVVIVHLFKNTYLFGKDFVINLNKVFIKLKIGFTKKISIPIEIKEPKNQPLLEFI